MENKVFGVLKNDTPPQQGCFTKHLYSMNFNQNWSKMKCEWKNLWAKNGEYYLHQYFHRYARGSFQNRNSADFAALCWVFAVDICTLHEYEALDVHWTFEFCCVETRNFHVPNLIDRLNNLEPVATAIYFFRINYYWCWPERTKKKRFTWSQYWSFRAVMWCAPRSRRCFVWLV